MFLFFRDVSTYSESEMMMNLSNPLDSIISKAKCTAEASALKIEALSGNHFYIVMLLWIAEHPSLPKILETSMYICLKFGCACRTLWISSM